MKQNMMDAEQHAAQEIIAKFGVEYSEIKLDGAGEFVAAGKNLQTFHALPLL